MDISTIPAQPRTYPLVQLPGSRIQIPRHSGAVELPQGLCVAVAEQPSGAGGREGSEVLKHKAEWDTSHEVRS